MPIHENELKHAERIFVDALLSLLESQKENGRHLGAILSTLQDLNDLTTKLAADVANQTSDIATIQANMTKQLADLNAEVQKLQTGITPPLDLTNITMSINQLETNHAALLALAKQAAGVDTIPPPAPLISTGPSSDQPTPPTVNAPI